MTYVTTSFFQGEHSISRVLSHLRGDDYLSSQPIARLLKRRNPEGQRATSTLPYSVLLRMGFTKPAGLPTAGALLPHLSTLTAGNLRRYLSVALALGSPPAAVSSYPVLRCSDFPHSIPAALSHSLLMDFYYTGFLPFCQVRIFIPFNSLTICFISAVHPYNPDIFLQPVFHMPHTLPSDYYTVHLWCMV